MRNYKIEGGLDFYTELYKSLDLDLNDSDSSNNRDTDTKESNECLITNTQLKENYVTMECGHKFNYEPLFYDILNHKKKFNSMERHILKTMEIRCPYCRNIQKNLLPYYEIAGIEKVHGVNFYDETKVYSPIKWDNGVCAYTDTTPNANGTPVVNCCPNKYVTKVDILGKTYCSYHKYSAIQKHMKEKKLLEKQKALEEKNAQKELKKQELAKEKELAKQEKLKQKELLKQEKKQNAKHKPALKSNPNTIPVTNIEENVVISSLAFCVQILHSGKNKGNPCGNKVSTNPNQLCSRHYKSTFEKGGAKPNI